MAETTTMSKDEREMIFNLLKLLWYFNDCFFALSHDDAASKQRVRVMPVMKYLILSVAMEFPEIKATEDDIKKILGEDKENRND